MQGRTRNPSKPAPTSRHPSLRRWNAVVACRSPRENPFFGSRGAPPSVRVWFGLLPGSVRADILSNGPSRADRRDLGLGRSEECAAARRELSFIPDHADRDAIDIGNLGAAKAKRIARAGLLLVGGVGPACRRQHRNRERGYEHRTELKTPGTNDEHESPRGVDARIVGERPGIGKISRRLEMAFPSETSLRIQKKNNLDCRLHRHVAIRVHPYTEAHGSARKQPPYELPRMVHDAGHVRSHDRPCRELVGGMTIPLPNSPRPDEAPGPSLSCERKNRSKNRTKNVAVTPGCVGSCVGAGTAGQFRCLGTGGWARTTDLLFHRQAL
jgi:hypothetical protein